MMKQFRETRATIMEKVVKYESWGKLSSRRFALSWLNYISIKSTSECCSLFSFIFSWEKYLKATVSKLVLRGARAKKRNQISLLIMIEGGRRKTFSYHKKITFLWKFPAYCEKRKDILVTRGCFSGFVFLYVHKFSNENVGNLAGGYFLQAQRRF